MTTKQTSTRLKKIQRRARRKELAGIFIRGAWHGFWTTTRFGILVIFATFLVYFTLTSIDQNGRLTIEWYAR